MDLKKKLLNGIKVLQNSDYRFLWLASKGVYNKMSDDVYLKRKFKALMGTELRLDNPKTFNEKLQWLKIHDRRPEYTVMVDKYAVKEYVADMIGDEYIVPTLGVWDKFDDIDFAVLPDEFVLKCTHDSGGLVICRDKLHLDIAGARKKINSSLKKNFYYQGREWPYKNVLPRIIAEPYLSDSCTPDLSSLTDYKVFCFSGEPQYLFVHTGRFKEHRQTVFDCDWNRQDITQAKDYGAPPAEYDIPKPDCLNCMLDLSRTLAAGKCHIRVDWYIMNGKLYFGELTFYDGSGFDGFDCYEDDLLLGKMIDLTMVYENQNLPSDS